MEPADADEPGGRWWKEKPMSSQPLLLKPHEAAALLGLSRSHVYALLKQKALPSIRVGKSVRVPREALGAWILEGTEAGQSPQDRPEETEAAGNPQTQAAQPGRRTDSRQVGSLR